MLNEWIDSRSVRWTQNDAQGEISSSSSVVTLNSDMKMTGEARCAAHM